MQSLSKGPTSALAAVRSNGTHIEPCRRGLARRADTLERDEGISVPKPEPAPDLVPARDVNRLVSNPVDLALEVRKRQGFR